MADSDFAFALELPGRFVRCSNAHMLANFLKALDDVGHLYLVKLLFSLIARVLFSIVYRLHSVSKFGRNFARYMCFTLPFRS